MFAEVEAAPKILVPLDILANGDDPDAANWLKTEPPCAEAPKGFDPAEPKPVDSNRGVPDEAGNPALANPVAPKAGFPNPVFPKTALPDVLPGVEFSVVPEADLPVPKEDFPKAPPIAEFPDALKNGELPLPKGLLVEAFPKTDLVELLPNLTCPNARGASFVSGVVSETAKTFVSVGLSASALGSGLVLESTDVSSEDRRMMCSSGL